MKYILFTAALAAFGFTSCKKDNNNPSNSNAKGALSIEFDNIAGASDLHLNSGSYTNSSGENFTVTNLKYYVSNFIVTKTDGTVYIVPQDSCYFLVDENNEASEFVQLLVPEGQYKTLQFTLGVDSIRNTKDISQRTGVLDPTGLGADMYWGWNSGYIFFKMEGNSSASSNGNYMYHIGGFGGYSSPTINNIKQLSFDLTQRGIPQVKAGKESNIHLLVDALKLFNGTNTLSIAANSMVMFDPYSSTIAGNFNGMFAHDHTEN